MSYPAVFSLSAFSLETNSCSRCSYQCPSVVLCSSCQLLLPRKARHNPDYASASAHSYLPPDQRGRLIDNVAQAETLLAITNEVIRDLETSREALESYIAGEKYRTASIRTLPNEVLGLIFSHVVQNNDIVTGNMPAVLLTHVCGQWREIVRGLPRLWSHIGISHIAQNDSITCEVLVQRLNHFHDLSGNHPLTVHIPDNSDDMENQIPVLSETPFIPFMVALTSKSQRWEELVIRSDLLLDHVHSLSLHRLTHLEIQDESWLGLPDIFPAVPLLHSIRAYRVGQSTFHRLPLEQLTHLRGSFEIQALVTNCARLSSLKDLTIDPDHLLSTTHPPAPGSCVLPSLKRLTMSEPLIAGLDPPFDTFSCPSMQQVAIEGAHLYFPKTLCDFLSSSIIGVTSLSLTNVWLSDPLEPILSAVPALKTLHLSHVASLLPDEFVPFSGVVMHKLARFQLLPLLEEFFFTATRAEWASEWRTPVMFGSFLRSRTVEFSDAPGRSALAAVHLRMSPDDTLEKLVAEIREGYSLDIRFETIPDSRG